MIFVFSRRYYYRSERGRQKSFSRSCSVVNARFWRWENRTILYWGSREGVKGRAAEEVGGVFRTGNDMDGGGGRGGG